MTSFVRHKIDWNLVFLLAIPFILFAANQEWLFPYGNPSDAWIGKRYLLETGHDYPLAGELYHTMYENYKATRISWAIKGLLTHKLFSPVTAQYVLHLSMFCMLLATFYLIVKHLFNKHVAFISSVAFGTYSQFHAVISFEWDYSTHDGALNLLLTLLFMLFASQSKRWKLWLMLAGATWASALQSTYLGTYIPAVAFWYLYLNHKYLRHPIIASALYVFAGAVTATLLYCIISYLLGGPFFFLWTIIEPMNIYSNYFRFHAGYWFPLLSLLQTSKGIVVPIFGFFVSVILLAINVIRKQKGQLINSMTLTQLTFLICLSLAFLLHVNGHGVMSSDHMLAAMAPFTFLSLAGLYAVLLRSINITDSLNAITLNTLKIIVFFLFLGALLFGEKTIQSGNHITAFVLDATMLNTLPASTLSGISLKILTIMIFFLVSATLSLVILKLVNAFLDRFSMRPINGPLLTAIILTFGLSGFLSLGNVVTSSIEIKSYGIANKCGIRKDQYKSVVDLFFKIRPYDVKSAPIRKTKKGIVLREPLLWYKNNETLEHPDARCVSRGAINMTALYGALLGLRGYAHLFKELLLEGYLSTHSFATVRNDRLKLMPKQFQIAIFYSNQNDRPTALATLESSGLKVKVLDEGQIENGAISFNFAILDLKKDDRTKAKYRN
jgi:hypothetical protein